MSETPFNHKKAKKQYGEFMRIVSAGAYSDRESNGSSVPDDVEKSIDELEYQAALRGLYFVRILKHSASDNQRYELQPMSNEQIATFTYTLTDEREVLQEIARGFKPFYLVLVHFQVSGTTLREYAGDDLDQVRARYASVASWRNWLESYGEVTGHHPLQVEPRRRVHHTIEVLRDGKPITLRELFP